MVEYTYTAWGYLRYTTGSLASTLGVKNHLRYRGYYYDTDMGLYYLMSRYYDPRTGRFINADDTAYIGADGSFASYSLFTYCGNNPVMNIDPSGNFSFPRMVLSIPLDVGFMALSPYLAPLKSFAKKFAGNALKTRLKTPLISLIKTVAKIATKILNAAKSIIQKIPIWGKKWASKINVGKLSKSIAGATTSAVFNTILNTIVPNITIFLSVGGFIAGFLDVLSDKKLNNRITIPFKW